MAVKQARTATPELHRVFQAVSTFYIAGVVIQAGDTVEAGHPMLRGRMAMFRPFVPTHRAPVSMVEPDPAPEGSEG